MSTKTITIEFDEAENPSSEDGWKLYSFERFSKSLKEFQEGYGTSSLILQKKLAEGLAFPLDRYEHSGVSWNLSGEGMQCEWDTAKNAGFIIWENETDQLGPVSPEDRKIDARLFLQSYNDWLNGHCYYYSIDGEYDEHIDSCGGIIGENLLVDLINEQIRDDDDIILEGRAVECISLLNLKGHIKEEVCR